MARASTKRMNEKLSEKALQMRRAGAFCKVLSIQKAEFKNYVRILERKTRKPTKLKWHAVDCTETVRPVGVLWRKECSETPGYLTYGCDIWCLEFMMATMKIRVNPNQDDEICQIYFDCLPDLLMGMIGGRAKGSDEGEVGFFLNYVSDPTIALSSVAGLWEEDDCFSEASQSAMSAAKKRRSLYWEKGDWTLPT